MAKLETIQARLQREEEKMSVLQLEKEEILKKIAAQQKKIDNLNAEYKTATFAKVAAASEARGIPYEALLKAIETGNFYDLQESIERDNSQAETEEETDGTPDEDVSENTDDLPSEDAPSYPAYGNYSDNVNEEG